ncbi:Fur family transcriptional regulator [Trueperella bernardiae]|uniref:Fur family transcriptional regulator n=2 Tax=Actinomycetaceae TaxID=2049 RepID=A0A0W1KLE3_9ACTO|nr:MULTISPECIES: Fur family transcriptional regulator [Trueperella]KTF04833.1 Zinc uptake regulation protein [Trueperella bernardiae]MCM3907253.1 transcriptional repressor [Trueperella bernardiae]MDK8601222.1 Fur family transcriptional regulator [Trueperella bernardiae]OCW61070.1 Fur family transcriptional regulator [Trueperella bernardiae]OFS65829.1 transcriptional repressor [Trueperella sp. HMSC08H06]
MRMTRQRNAIATLLEETEEFLPAQRIHELLLERGEKVGLATVYRNLQALAEQGSVDVLRQEGTDVQLFRHCKDDGHHHHLLCRSCGRTVELFIPQLEDLTKGVAKEHGFTDISHDIEIYGLCANCAEDAAS